MGERATGVFRVVTECHYGPTKGSESPLATEDRERGFLFLWGRDLGRGAPSCSMQKKTYSLPQSRKPQGIIKELVHN